MNDELMLLNMLSTLNQKQSFARNFQQFAQAKMNNFADNAVIKYIGNDTFVQVDYDVFKRIDNRILNNFENVREIIICYRLVSNEQSAYGHYVDGYVEETLTFRCRDLKDILIHFYDVDQYRQLFQMLKEKEFLVWMNFNGMDIVYNDGTFDRNQSIETFMYHFLYTHPGNVY